MNHLLEIDFLSIIIRSTGTFITLLILTRLLGKKQLSQLTFFNYVTGTTLGSLAAGLSVHNGLPFLDGAISLIWWSLLTFFVTLMALKSGKARALLDDEPILLIKRGHILEDALKTIQLNMKDLSTMLRKQHIFSINEVDYAILEPDGKLSVLKKQRKQPLGKLVSIQYLPTELVVDGKLVPKNLQELNLSEEWLKEQLRQAGYPNWNDIFYVEIQSDGTLYVDLRQDPAK
jgi:uncharacterized membrane protein YcaP (DUF421 family)